MLTLQMDREDWRKLHAYLSAANRLKQTIEETMDSGKQQLTVNSEAVQSLVATRLPPDFWLKLGSLLGSKLQQEDPADA